MKSTVALLAAICVTTSACDGKPPIRAYDRFGDKLRAATGGIFGAPCFEATADDKDIDEFVGHERCFVLNKPQRLRGIWLTEFEASMFLPDRTAAPEIWRWTINDTELVVGKPAPEWMRRISHASPRRATYIEFVGRAQTYPTKNPLGGHERFVIVDRVLKAEPLRPPASTLFCLPVCESP